MQTPTPDQGLWTLTQPLKAYCVGVKRVVVPRDVGSFSTGDRLSCVWTPSSLNCFAL